MFLYMPCIDVGFIVFERKTKQQSTYANKLVLSAKWKSSFMMMKNVNNNKSQTMSLKLKRKYVFV